MDNIDNVRLFLKSLDSSVGQLEASVEPILKKSLDELVAKSAGTSDQVERIKLYNNFTYVLISVLFSYLKSSGVNTDTHPIMKELARIKTYMNRLKDLEKTSVNQENDDKLNSERAKEFLQHTLGSKGTGAAAPTKLSSPAISSSNFTGTHTKFKDDEPVRNTSKSRSTTPVNKKKKPKSNRISKPKRK